MGEVHSDKLKSHPSSWEPSKGESKSPYAVSIEFECESSKQEFKRWGEGVIVFEIEQMGKAGIEVGGRVSVERCWTRGQMHSAWIPHLRIRNTPPYGFVWNSASTWFWSNRFDFKGYGWANPLKNHTWLHIIPVIAEGIIKPVNFFPFNFKETWTIGLQSCSFNSKTTQQKIFGK